MFLEELNYTIVRNTINSDIEIVEINENGCDYHDFVLIYFYHNTNHSEQTKQLINQYKATHKIECFIGCFDFQRIAQNEISLNTFDLLCNIRSYKEFEHLVLACPSIRTGFTHGDPVEWLGFRFSSTHLIDIFSEADTDFNSLTKTITTKFSTIKKNSSNITLSILFNNDAITEKNVVKKTNHLLKKLFKMDKNLLIYFIMKEEKSLPRNEIRIAIITEGEF